jgi:hypothetical protein
MNEKNIKSSFVNKHDIEANWKKATRFVPKQGELIIYDDRYTKSNGEIVIVASRVRYKIGDGVTNVNDLPFASDSIDEDTEYIFDGGTSGFNVEISDVGGTIWHAADPNEILTVEDNEAGGQTAIID